MNFLERIVSDRPKPENIVPHERSRTPLSLSGAIESRNKGDKLAIISEIKPRSPSSGTIRSNFDVIELAREMENGGAAAISVLTEPVHFGGSLENVTKVSAHVKIPVLRKDFLRESSEISDSYYSGADAVLAIVALLKDETHNFVSKCSEIGLETLVEIHDESEIDLALNSRAGTIGINNRDLRTLEVDLKTTERLIDEIPSDRLIVSESGISGPSDAEYLAGLGVNAVLVGSSIMSSDNIFRSVSQLAEISI